MLTSGQAILLAFTALTIVSYTYPSEARINCGPACALVIDAVHIRDHSPSTAVHDPSSGDAKVWDVKLIDHDGDGIPDEDRVASNYSGVGFMVGKGLKSSTTFRVGRRHIVVAAHVFADKSTGHVNPEVGNERVIFRSCSQEIYRAQRRVCGTSNVDNDQIKDYCVIELDRDLCSEAETFEVGYPYISEKVKDLDLQVTGFYMRDVIGEPTVKSQIAGEEGPLTRGPLKTSNLGQFTSYGRITFSEIFNGQRLDYYRMGQHKGGSGGPIFHIDPSDQKTVVGIQFMHPWDPNANYNYSIAMDGPFLSFLRLHVPDLKIRTNFEH